MVQIRAGSSTDMLESAAWIA